MDRLGEEYSSSRGSSHKGSMATDARHSLFVDTQAASRVPADGEDDDEQDDSDDAGHDAPGGSSSSSVLLSRNRSNPGPGEYMWNDNVHIKRKPVWSMASPDRKHLDLMLGTWTPASTSLQPRAPDPGEYVCKKPAGKNGVFFSPQWTFERGSVRPCLAEDPVPTLQLDYKLPAFGGVQPTKKTIPLWSVVGKDRSMLPAAIGTWTPSTGSDLRPGPGTYDLDRVGRKWKNFGTRRGCTWGGRQTNLHPEVKAWVPKTKGSCGIPGGEMARLDIFPHKGSPVLLCSCLYCPGPCMCSSDKSPRSRQFRGIYPTGQKPKPKHLSGAHSSPTLSRESAALDA